VCYSHDSYRREQSSQNGQQANFYKFQLHNHFSKQRHLTLDKANVTRKGLYKFQKWQGGMPVGKSQYNASPLNILTKSPFFLSNKKMR
jgi:hypothetical protein